MIKKLRKLMKEQEIEAYLLSGIENPMSFNNLHYITNYTGSYGVAIVTQVDAYFVSDFRYREQVMQEVKEFRFIEIEKTLHDTLKEIIGVMGIKTLSFDPKITYKEYQTLELLDIELTPKGELIELLREQKTSSEIAKIKKACEIADEALDYTLKKIKPGMKECEVEVLLKNKMIDLGADKTWDRFIVASGKRGSMPHGMASDKEIQEGELITFDIGCFYQGYSSDLTRTIALGDVSDQLKEIYHIVYEAQKRAVGKARAGMSGKELDMVCRDYITKAGFGENFKHGTGHGLGLDVHESPSVSYRNDEPLKNGVCVTIEPGIYISGLGGVRIEDDVILHEDGCTVLNRFPKELIVIPVRS
jgi:Xaa-Pro aminopeptidase